MDITVESRWVDKLLDIAKSLMVFAREGDHSNGNVFYGIDEGAVRAQESLLIIERDLKCIEDGWQSVKEEWTRDEG